ncbi:MAG: amidohydrolase [Gemmatimonadota bacterium]|nr:MAG: amidohydrolase [Gemmatimonadota bacterium]
MTQRLGVRIALISSFVFLCGGPLVAQDLSLEKQTALEMVDGLSSEIHLMSMRLWDYSEIALLEAQSAEFLAALLEEEGFKVERGLADMPTAFVASWGSGHPIIGVLAEYDALPGIGNAPVPHRAPREDEITAGQGCGHNLFGAGSVGAAIAIKRTMERHGLEGTVRLYGTPAEETVVGKVYMAKAGVFDDLDAAFEWHPSLETGVRNQPGRALNNFTVEFFGQAAHGAGDPWNGRSALDAVELMNYGVNLMREHIRPEARIHYVIPAAGDAPNVVPEYAKVWYYVREADREKVQEYYDWILKIAEGAAMATRTTHEVSLITGVHETLLNRPLQEVMQRNLGIVGAPPFSDEYQEFARELQRSLELEETGLDTEIQPLADEPEPVSGGSTDVAEVSYIAPTVGLRVTTAAADIPWHSWAVAASHGREGSIAGATVAAKVMALTGIDLLTDPALLQAANEFFLEQTGGAPYVSPVPAEQKPPVPEQTSGNDS